MLIRAGRFISVPDIEAQLAPNNYMYSHSFTYGYDNYTDTGINVAIQLNKNWMIQAGLLDGQRSLSGSEQQGPRQAALPRGVYPLGFRQRVRQRLRLRRRNQQRHMGLQQTCNGLASPTITSSTSAGTCRPSIGTSTRITSST
jgi:hypothetical protein